LAKRRRIASIAGARPNFMKIAPIVAALRRRPESFESMLVHTGQHYDEKMSQVFFDELGIPRRTSTSTSGQAVTRSRRRRS
jgi:UDP-N-acetylglucosamine 2-epimerase (non-hydrolysing)